MGILKEKHLALFFTDRRSLMKKLTSLILALMMLLCASTSITAETLTVASPLKGEISGEIAVESDGTRTYIAYTDMDRKVHLVTYGSRQGTQNRIVPSILEGYVEDLALFHDGSLALAYGWEGNLWITRTEDGVNFSRPVPVYSSAEAVSIADFAISDDDTLYTTYHRHSPNYDFNLAISRDRGTSFSVTKDFTGRTDSSSTGYTGQIEYLAGGLYTAYQDNNHAFAVKFRYSSDGGKSWSLASIPSSLGVLDLAVNPRNPDLALISILNEQGSFVYRSSNARASKPVFTLTYEDTDVSFSRSHIRYTDIGFKSDGTAVLVYLNENDEYILLTSRTGGQSWGGEEIIGSSVSRAGWWQPDLEIAGETVLFAFYNREGNVDLYTSASQSISSSSAQKLIPDGDGNMYLEDILSSFSFVLFDGAAVIFAPEETGVYTLTHETQSSSEALFVIYDLYSDSEDGFANNWETGELEDSISSVVLESGGIYLLLVSPLDEASVSDVVTFSFSPSGTMESPPEPLYEIPYDIEADITWGMSAVDWRGMNGTRIQVTLPPGGTNGPVWGDGIYTDDSLIGVAAVHAGLITFSKGGTVVLEILGPQDSYTGSFRHNVTSGLYGSWHGSYRFVE